ncbi:ribonuclease Z [Bacillus sp. 3255]|uniref:MBL fold metallo-hydrolase n=1 Tax=Bacillus sp. 3255 TaxID=2817904 RepID=UPI002862D2DB|nr:ribonuclease Z [Bacillus sp. 3255]MDR6883317.1 ribonuclease Z [Bacillus sp. 3255]
MDITLLGTAAAAGGAERDNTYLLLRHGESYTMIDVGGNPLGKLAKLGVDVNRVDRVIFTHAHIDHVYGFPSLLWGMWLAKRMKPLTVHCSEEQEPQLRKWLDVMEIDAWPIQFSIDIRTFDWTKESYLAEEEHVAISAFPSLHLGPTAGLSIRYLDKVLVYSADTELNPWIKERAHIDVLIHEATTAERSGAHHSSLQGIADYYPLERIGRIVAVHITDSEPYENVLGKLPPAASAKISLGFDLMTISL